MGAENGLAGSTVEGARLAAIRRGVHWRRWGPYLSERQWGTVREDYSSNGDAWDYLPHDHARSRAYRWGEDGIGGFGDDQLLLCLGLALWNGRDPILKERLVRPDQSPRAITARMSRNCTTTSTARRRTRICGCSTNIRRRPFPTINWSRKIGGAAGQPEFELVDTGVFADNRYFDVEIEYAKADTDDILLQVTVHNRAAEAACCMCCRSSGRATSGRGRPIQ